MSENGHRVEVIELSRLVPHPNNYRNHTEEQLAHIAHSLETYGFYRNVVVARDYTILAGHGVCEACPRVGITRVPVVKLDLDPHEPKALKVLAGDNEMQRLAEVNDRALTEMLRKVHEEDSLLGTGFDPMQLANLVFVTRPADEIADINAAREWIGLPAYDVNDPRRGDEVSITISFLNEVDRDRYVQQTGLEFLRAAGKRWTTTWPLPERMDRASARFVDGEEEVADEQADGAAAEGAE